MPVIVATLLGAEPDPRAGLWLADAVVNGHQRTLWLALQIDAPSYGEKYPENGLWIPPVWGLEEQGYTCSPNDVHLIADRVSFRCIRFDAARPGLTRGADYSFEGRFERGADLIGRWRLGEQEISAHYTRPRRTGSSQMQGDWVATGGGRTCILHLYDDPPRLLDYGQAWFKGTIDRFEIGGSARSGEPLMVGTLSDGSVSVWDPVAGAPGVSLGGKLDLEAGTFSAEWTGGVSLGCRERSAPVLFKRQPLN